MRKKDLIGIEGSENFARTDKIIIAIYQAIESFSLGESSVIPKVISQNYDASDIPYPETIITVCDDGIIFLGHKISPVIADNPNDDSKIFQYAIWIRNEAGEYNICFGYEDTYQTAIQRVCASFIWNATSNNMEENLGRSGQYDIWYKITYEYYDPTNEDWKSGEIFCFATTETDAVRLSRLYLSSKKIAHIKYTKCNFHRSTDPRTIVPAVEIVRFD